ncbi:alpha/beta hydrolase [Oxalobacter vibrioformis]|uniref:Alpha/beta hydrolase n=1 Tax=Oxalobacter vibrioformis TaxID=933080 RepID=A0A9E9LX26_9BURK|nr:alpha/beta hydrolase [Oxalobacter vibrioformis]WAW10444.1 alpha/beta hydrolase [Oxalobacter vibrioformis]
MKLSRSEFLSVRGMRFHIRHWGSADAPAIFMLHGWMDSSITFQFLVDALQEEWHIIAPDWRGFGHSSHAKDGYWFPDYLADLDALLNHYSRDTPVRLLGHSLGGNVACLYASVRPARVRQLVSLEGYGMMRMEPDQAAARYGKWLDSLHAYDKPRGFASLDEVVRRVKRNNPRLTDERALFIASHWAQQNEDGMWRILADPHHRRINPVMTRMDEVLASWGLITAPTLMVDGEFSLLGMRMGDYEKGREEIRSRASVIPDVKVVMIPDAGHMVQQDQPEVVAELIEDFLV